MRAKVQEGRTSRDDLAVMVDPRMAVSKASMVDLGGGEEGATGGVSGVGK